MENIKLEISMKNRFILIVLALNVVFGFSCTEEKKNSTEITAADILGNPEYPAISYGGYREISRETVPTVEQIKEDMKLLEAMGIKIIRTYNSQQFAQAANILKAIRELKDENPDFEMYVMLGAWIDCLNAWTTKETVHDVESLENNTAEINAAVAMANEYPDIVKVIAVGNEAMINWAASYYVTPDIILKWVNHLQDLKKKGELPEGLWITSSDNYESWGGGSKLYHTEDLTALIKAVDYVSLHTYPFHESHYNPDYWYVPEEDNGLTAVEKAEKAVMRAKDFAKNQYEKTAKYVKSIAPDKPMHIGETGWASVSGGFYGENGSRAADEYKEKLFYEYIREWTNAEGISCFYFEAFDEKWKDAEHVKGSENHFGLMTIDGKAKYVLWDLFDKGAFDGLTRNGNKITKTFGGDKDAMMKNFLAPPSENDISNSDIKTTNDELTTGDVIGQKYYTVLVEDDFSKTLNDKTYPSAKLKLNGWEGTSAIQVTTDDVLEITTGHEGEGWWGCGAELKADGKGENLSNFSDGYFNFEIKGDTKSSFQIGFQTGSFSEGTQINNFIIFNKDKKNAVTGDWTKHSIKISDLLKDKKLEDVTSLIYFRGNKNFDGKKVFLKNIYYSQSK
ncbi:MAG: glycosyl hydrolase family 17 protein [Saprospiraceae bacterium]